MQAAAVRQPNNPNSKSVMNLSSPYPPKDTVKPWVSQVGPMVSFLCDDGSLYLSQFGSIAAVSPDPQRVEVFAPPHGVIAIFGPEVRALCAALELQRATLIRKDGVALTSVTRLTDKEYAARQIGAELPTVHPEPDLDELD